MSHRKQDNELIFLKLGGSLITDKSIPGKADYSIISQISEEIAMFRNQYPETRLLIGHGSGSFAHVPAKKYGTRKGVFTGHDWMGFAEVWWQASELNRIVVEYLRKQRIDLVVFPPSSSIVANKGKIINWNLENISKSLIKGKVPVIYGDVVFDQELGGTILSTEELFVYLGKHLNPSRILIAGQEPGVWGDYKNKDELIKEISRSEYTSISSKIHEAGTIDVTGGMATKIDLMIKLIEELPELQVDIFSGKKPGDILKSLKGDHIGTRLRY